MTHEELNEKLAQLSKIEIPCTRHPIVKSLSQKRRLAFQCDACFGTDMAGVYPWTRTSCSPFLSSYICPHVSSENLAIGKINDCPNWRPVEIGDVNLVKLLKAQADEFVEIGGSQWVCDIANGLYEPTEAAVRAILSYMEENSA